MSNASALHTIWVRKAESLRDSRTRREEALRSYAARRQPQGQAMVERDHRAGSKFVGDGLVATDLELQDLITQEARAVQIAIMYGISALVER